MLKKYFFFLYTKFTTKIFFTLFFQNYFIMAQIHFVDFIVLGKMKII